jgi:uncharacterized protein YaaR (DUF327 family)
MAIGNIFKKGVALSQGNQCKTHSSTGVSNAQAAISSFQSAKSKKGEQKLDALADGLINLSKAIIEVSKSIAPIATMNMWSALLSENIGEIMEENRSELLKELKKK